jgi:hypothetical protein
LRSVAIGGAPAVGEHRATACGRRELVDAGPMGWLPDEPVAPAELLERTVPALFQGLGMAAVLDGTELRLGVALAGEGGGEWRLDLAGGGLAVAAGTREGAAVTWVQSVEDLRGALWGGRGGAAEQLLAGLLQRGAQSLASGRRRPPEPDWFRRLAGLDGLLALVVTGTARGDWRVALRFGPGPIPEEPRATVSVASDDLAALARGALNPLEAFLSGRVSIAGDMLLVMQLQALLAPLLIAEPPGNAGVSG